MANYELNIYKKFGVAWPIMCSGGIGFGSFILYKSFTDKFLRNSKFLLRQYQLFGMSLLALNAYGLLDYLRNK